MPKHLEKSVTPLSFLFSQSINFLIPMSVLEFSWLFLPTFLIKTSVRLFCTLKFRECYFSSQVDVFPMFSGKQRLTRLAQNCKYVELYEDLSQFFFPYKGLSQLFSWTTNILWGRPQLGVDISLPSQLALTKDLKDLSRLVPYAKTMPLIISAAARAFCRPQKDWDRPAVYEGVC